MEKSQVGSEAVPATSHGLSLECQRGKAYATWLVGHLLRMSAAEVTIPVTADGVEFEVIVRAKEKL